MTDLQCNKAVPDFSASATSDQTVCLAKLRGKNVVIYFYPKDNTPGCTMEGKDFRDQFADFQQEDTVILGVSADSLTKHENFKAKHQFPFELISDPDHTLARLFGAYGDKVLFGKKYQGIIRSTFLLDKKGILRQAWYKVKVKGHVTEVLASIKQLSA